MNQETLSNPDLLHNFEFWANILLTWVGFGTLVGLLAKAIMPGRDPGGSIATLAMARWNPSSIALSIRLMS